MYLPGSVRPRFHLQHCKKRGREGGREERKKGKSKERKGKMIG
jgi:hypothetical protein